MALFNQSTLAVSAACQQIAGAAGASADTEMTTKAGVSLNAALTYFNARANWDFLRTETLIGLTGPFGVSATASGGNVSATANSGHGILVDDVISGPGWLAGTRVTATAAGSFSVDSTIRSDVPTAGQVVNVQRDLYPVPSDFKAFYSERLYGAMTAPRMIGQRLWDRSISNEFGPSTPIGYSDFDIGKKGKVRVLPPPTAAETLRLRYYRRMTVPTTTATADPLDIPQDYEMVLIAWAKWHFLMDKGEGRGEQAQTWIAFANDGIKTMLADQTRKPDDDLSFYPGAYSYNVNMGPNSVRGILDEPW